MATIRKKNDKWQVQIRRNGFSPVSKTFSKKLDATEWARMMDSKADRGVLPDLRILGTTKLEDLVERYCREIVSQKKSKSVETIVLRAFLRQKICKKNLSAITMKDWTQYRDSRLLTISSKSLKRQLSPLSHMFNLAIEDWGIPLPENPLNKLKLNSEDRRRNRRLKDGEEQTLLSIASMTKPGYLETLIKLAIETAMRRREILSIKRKDIDLQSALLQIPVAKNGHARTIPLTNSALKILESACVDAQSAESCIFTVSEDALRHSWSRTCKKAHIHDLHFHDLRHEAISRFFEMGLTTPEVALISGHKDIRMLFRYAHATQQSIFGKFRSLSTPD